MKKMLLVILSACLIACVAFAVPPAKTSSDQFVDQFVGWLKGNKVDMSEREKEALRDTHVSVLPTPSIQPPRFARTLMPNPNKGGRHGKAEEDESRGVVRANHRAEHGRRIDPGVLRGT